MNGLFTLPAVLPYAETHYKFKLPYSPLFKKWPEIFIDGPRFCVPGKKPRYYLAIKDADFFPVRICEVNVTLQYAGKLETQILELNHLANRQMEFLVLNVEFPEDAGRILINAKIVVENKKGRRREIFNSNLSGLGHTPLVLEMLRDPLPYPENWFAGETHCHSSYTSNPIEFGAPLKVLQETADALGLGYVVCTDHSWDFYYDKDNFMANIDPGVKWQQYRREALDLNTNKETLPLIIPGEEISCGNHLGQNVHMIVMGYPDFIPGLGDGGRRWLNNRPCRTIREVLEEIGNTPCFAAHPRVRMALMERFIFRRGIWHEKDITPNPPAGKLTGLQFWNGHRKRDFSLGRTFWVRQLLNGHRLLPAGGNDAHGDLNYHTGVKFPLLSLYLSMNHIFGMVRTLVQTQGNHRVGIDDIQQGMRKGNQICTDGPFLSLELEGSRLTVTARSITGFGDLHKIHLFSGAKGEPKETVVKSWVHEPGVFEFQDSLTVDKSVDYLRAEGWTWKDKLAITSPVFLNGNVEE
ncbi:hypothetical protein ACFL5V_07705 [Fibrobacterota bacterium]